MNLGLYIVLASIYEWCFVTCLSSREHDRVLVNIFLLIQIFVPYFGTLCSSVNSFAQKTSVLGFEVSIWACCYSTGALEHKIFIEEMHNSVSYSEYINQILSLFLYNGLAFCQHAFSMSLLI